MTDKQENAMAGCIEASVYLFVLYPLHVAVAAYAGWKLWTWFAVPVLGGQAIGYGYALVGAAFVAWLKPVPPDDGKKRELRQMTERVLSLIMMHLMFLLIGYIGHRMVAA